MANFEYIAIDGKGKRVAGVLAGASEQAVLSELESRQLLPVNVAPVKERRVRRTVSAAKLGQSYAAMADLLHAGVPLLRVLKLLGNRKSTPALSAVFRELAEAVAAGEELHSVMASKPEVFPPVQVAMVRAGEKGGFLEAVLQRLGQLVLAQAEMRSKVVMSLAYPAIIAFVGVGVLGFIFGAMVPAFRGALEKQGSTLPWITRVVFGLSDLVRSYAIGVIIALAAGFFLLRWVLARPRVRAWLERVRTKMPVLGPLTRALAAARFCRMLGTMLGNNVPMLTALTISKDAAGNALMQDAIDRAAASVKAGQSLSGPLGESGLFEDDVIEMIHVGESANNVDQVLLNVADALEKRVSKLLSAAVLLIEPLLIVIIALLVGAIAISLVLPLVSQSARM